MIIERTVILTGARAGMTVKLGKFQFTNGELKFRLEERDMEGIVKYLIRCYQVEVEDGERKIDSITGRGDSAPLPSIVQQDGSGFTFTSANDSSGNVKTEARPTGSVPSGDGLEDSGDDGSSRQKERILAAIEKLDHANADHWTMGGHPRVEAIEAFVGSPVSRNEIQAVAPDFMRKENK